MAFPDCSEGLDGDVRHLCQILPAHFSRLSCSWMTDDSLTLAEEVNVLELSDEFQTLVYTSSSRLLAFWPHIHPPEVIWPQR